MIEGSVGLSPTDVCLQVCGVSLDGIRELLDGPETNQLVSGLQQTGSKNR